LWRRHEWDVERAMVTRQTERLGVWSRARTGSDFPALWRELWCDRRQWHTWLRAPPVVQIPYHTASLSSMLHIFGDHLDIQNMSKATWKGLSADISWCHPLKYLLNSFPTRSQLETMLVSWQESWLHATLLLLPKGMSILKITWRALYNIWPPLYYIEQVFYGVVAGRLTHAPSSSPPLHLT